MSINILDILSEYPELDAENIMTCDQPLTNMFVRIQELNDTNYKTCIDENGKKLRFTELRNNGKLKTCIFQQCHRRRRSAAQKQTREYSYFISLPPEPKSSVFIECKKAEHAKIKNGNRGF